MLFFSLRVAVGISLISCINNVTGRSVCLHLCGDAHLNHALAHIALIVISIATLPSLQSSLSHTLQPIQFVAVICKARHQITGIKAVANKSGEVLQASCTGGFINKAKTESKSQCLNGSYGQTQKGRLYSDIQTLIRRQGKSPNKGMVITVYMAKDLQRHKSW